MGVDALASVAVLAFGAAGAGNGWVT